MEKNIVILHGWQSKIAKWQSFKKLLQKKFKVYLPVLPGFGSQQLKNPLNLDDYCSWLKAYLKANNIKKPILIGHSFGARIAIKFSSQNHQVLRLVLIAAAGLKSKWGLKKFAGLILAKLGKLVFVLPPFSFFKKPASWLLYTILGEKDYYQADKNLKITMKNILKEDLKKYLSKIKAPTLICWGDKDKTTPIKDAYLMAKKIKKSKLVIYKKAGHSLPFKKTKQLVELITDFC